MADDDTTTVVAPLMKDVIPADLHDREYLKPWLDKSADKAVLAEVFKKLDGAESLIGKKTLMPGPDAKDDEVNAFYDKIRADKPEDYDFTLGETPDEEFTKELQAAAHAGRLSKKQMTDFIGHLSPKFAARQKVANDAKEALDKEFEELMVETYKEDGKKITETVKGFLEENVPDNLKTHVGRLDNKALAILAGITHHMMEKYMSEDDLKGGAGGGSGNENDREALQTEARKLQGSEAWHDFRHADHEKTKKRVAEIYASPAFKTTK